MDETTYQFYNKLTKEQRLKKCSIIANNALYFADNSDYQTALWTILTILKPELFKETSTPKLEYIEEKPEIGVIGPSQVEIHQIDISEIKFNSPNYSSSFWEKETQETFTTVYRQLLSKGFTEQEAKDLLEKLYAFVASEYGE